MNTETNGLICINGALSALLAQIGENLSVPESQTARDALEDEIAPWQMLVAEAQSKIAALKFRQNELLPIHRLPTEVLSIILSMTLPLKRHHKERTKLLLVCRRWTSIIDGNPSTFWATLSTEDPLTQRARLLRKASQMPITIVAGSQYSSYINSSDFVQSINPNDTPFHDLVIGEYTGSWMEEVFANCLAAPAPQLHSLDLEVDAGWVLGGEDPNSQHLRMFSGVAPSLKSVRLSGVWIPWNSVILQNLHSLTLEYPDRYRTDVGETPSLEQMIGILRSCPALQTLILRDMDFERSNQVQLPPLSLDRLTTINLSMSSFQSIFSLLRHIQFPKTATMELAGKSSTLQDDDDEILSATLYLLQQHLSIKSFHLAIDESVVQLSTPRLNFSILNHVWRKRSRYYKELLSRLGSPTRTAITSLHLDFPASPHSTASRGALNGIIAKLTDLPVHQPHVPKLEKPGNVVLEEVPQISEDIRQSTSVCPNLRSLEITVGDPNSLDLAAILKLVRMRKSNMELNGKHVVMAPITFIRITFQRGRLSLDHMDLLDELKSEVANGQYVMPPETEESQTIQPPLSASSDSSDEDM